MFDHVGPSVRATRQAARLSRLRASRRVGRFESVQVHTPVFQGKPEHQRVRLRALLLPRSFGVPVLLVAAWCRDALNAAAATCVAIGGLGW